MKKEEKAVSPIIASALLILIVFILGVIIWIWSQGFISEAVTKEIAGQEKTAEQFCAEVGLQPILNNDRSFGFKNSGNIPVYAFSLKLTEKNSGSSFDIKVEAKDNGSVNPGFSKIVEKTGGGYYNYDDYEKVEILPILLGKLKSSGGLQELECDKTYALEI